ncbi:MAG: hypothetical protein JO078_08415 [Candidatus Eremiobacteraeota bacterium]|nr:hypothetical protein [Candidatus Eremiobacteraeota bacterium]
MPAFDRGGASRSRERVRYRIVMTRGALVTVALALLLGSSADDLRVSLRTTAAAYYAKMAAIAPVAGPDTTYDYYERLRDDADTLDASAVPAGYTAQEWSVLVRRTATLDLSLAQQLLGGQFTDPASIRGLGETLVRSSRDGAMQPVAIYVPSSYRAARPAPVIVWLHGRPQSESELLATPGLTDLAEQTGSILVAPWGHGYYNFRGSAEDVYDALHAAQRAFAVDPRKQFLAGYSMGGFSVFEVAPVHPTQWAAVMSVAGSLLGTNAQRVLSTLARTPFYILTGTKDDSIPTQFPATTAVYLAQAGVGVSFYSQPGGTHRLVTILPILNQAFHDMLSGIVRTPPAGFMATALPASIPPMTMRP